jgi:hypothetical protein
VYFAGVDVMRVNWCFDIQGGGFAFFSVVQLDDAHVLPYHYWVADSIDATSGGSDYIWSGSAGGNL